MFERFSESARQVVVLAHDEARILKHNYIGTEHILLGLLRERDGLAARALESLDVTIERVRAEVVRLIGTGEEAPEEQIPFTPRATRTLELALREATSIGHDQVEPEHVLLGVLGPEGVAMRVLEKLGVTSEAIRERLVSLLTQRRSAAKIPSPGPSPLSPDVERLLDRARQEAAREGAGEVELRHLVRALADAFPPAPP